MNLLKEPDNRSSKKNPVGRFMVAVGAVIELNTTGKILLIKRDASLDWRPNEWETSYGRIDQFEDPEVGLRREVYEELGIKKLEIFEALRIWHLFRGSQKPENELIGITYRCRTSEEKINLSEEHSAYQWILPLKAQTLVNDGIQKDIRAFEEIIKKI